VRSQRRTRSAEIGAAGERLVLLSGPEGRDPAFAARSDACADSHERAFSAWLRAVAPALAATIGADPDGLAHLRADEDAPALTSLHLVNVAREERLRAWYQACRRGRHLTAIRLLRGDIDAAQAARAYSDLADAALADIMAACAAEFAAMHGHVRGGRHALVAIGRLGARELTLKSDLDLLLLYDCDDSAAVSDGAQPLPAGQYYTRLTQRLIASASCSFGDGPLFAVDFRMRPWGSKGPIATRVASLREYFAAEAWSFEAMALTRARVVAASRGFGVEVEGALRDAIMAVRARMDLRAGALDMRRRVQREKASRRVWDIKCVAGGLMDIDFIVHTLAIEHAEAFEDVAMHDMAVACRTLARVGALSRVDAVALVWALDLYQTAIQHLRVALPAPYDARTMPDAFAALLARASGAADIRDLESRLREAQRAVRQIFEATLGKSRASGRRAAA
jgi:glutamate-ammonia-ligase adenylyltransferase